MIYYRWILGYTVTLDYWISIYALLVLEDTWIKSLQSKPSKDENIGNVQYMEPMNEIFKT